MFKMFGRFKGFLGGSGFFGFGVAGLTTSAGLSSASFFLPGALPFFPFFPFPFAGSASSSTASILISGAGGGVGGLCGYAGRSKGLRSSSFFNSASLAI